MDERIRNQRQYEQLVQEAGVAGYSVFSDRNHLYVSAFGKLGIFEISDKGVTEAMWALRQAIGERNR